MFSKKTVIEIAIISGYKSQQAFTDIFKAMYKTSPAEFRKTGKFYPLQLEIQLKNPPSNMDLKKDDIVFATYADVEDWMELASQALMDIQDLTRQHILINCTSILTWKGL